MIRSSVIDFGIRFVDFSQLHNHTIMISALFVNEIYDTKKTYFTTKITDNRLAFWVYCILQDHVSNRTNGLKQHFCSRLRQNACRP